MLKMFVIYVLIAGATMVLYSLTSLKKELKEGIEAIKKEYDVTDKQVYIVFYILLVSLGWAWVPYKIVRTLIKLIRGEK